MKDLDFDELISRIRKESHSDLQMQKWKNAVHAELYKTENSGRSYWLQLVAASIVGFLVGGLSFSFFMKTRDDLEFSNLDSDSATIEYVLTKTN